MISIVIPIYSPNNDFSVAKPSFQSLCMQTYRDFEIIVVNDGCSDIEKLNAFVKESVPNDIQCTITHHDHNRSALQAKITGILKARRKYVLLLDCDDKINPNLIKRATSHLAKYNPDILSFFLKYTRPGQMTPKRKFEVMFGKDIIKHYLNSMGYEEYLICHKCIRRSLAVEAISKSAITPTDHINVDDVMVLGVLFHCEAETYIKDDNVGKYIYINDNSDDDSRNSKKFNKKEYKHEYERSFEICKEFLAKKHLGDDILKSFLKYEPSQAFQ